MSFWNGLILILSNLVLVRCCNDINLLFSCSLYECGIFYFPLQEILKYEKSENKVAVAMLKMLGRRSFVEEGSCLLLVVGDNLAHLFSHDYFWLSCSNRLKQHMYGSSVAIEM